MAVWSKIKNVHALILRDRTSEYRSQRNSHVGAKETDTRKFTVVLF